VHGRERAGRRDPEQRAGGLARAVDERAAALLGEAIEVAVAGAREAARRGAVGAVDEVLERITTPLVFVVVVVPLLAVT
jgi:hypothetical protein